ncbi:hypothetical protein D3C81_1387450 [compost metagenome]
MGRFRFQLRLQRELILLGARHFVFFGDVFRRDAHVVLVVHVPQAVDDHGVDHLEVAHAETVARTVHRMRRGAHVFLAAGDDDVGVAALDRLRRQVRCLQAAAADFIDGKCGDAARQASLDHGLARGVLADGGRQYLAQDRFADQVRVDAGLCQQALDYMRAQFGRRNLGQAATEFADCGTAGGHDYDIIHLFLRYAGHDGHGVNRIQ